MQAMVLTDFGGTENFNFSEIDIPQPDVDEVLIHIAATSLNPIDLKTRVGQGAANFSDISPPLILGWDLSGTVVSVGSSVNEWHPGDQVFGSVGFPGLGRTNAQYTVVPAAHLARKPDGISHIDCAASAMTGLTAFQAIHPYIKPETGPKVLIHGAGGVGTMAIQIASSLGAQVIATSSNRNRAHTLALGAHSVIDYHTTPFDAYPREFDFILDTVGGDTTLASLDMLREGGTLVSILPTKDVRVKQKAASTNRSFHFVLMKSNGDHMNEVATLLAQKKLKQSVGLSLPLSQLPYAHKLFENHTIPGKIVLTP